MLQEIIKLYYLIELTQQLKLCNFYNVKLNNALCFFEGAFIVLKLCYAKNKSNSKFKRNNNLCNLQVITQNFKYVKTKCMPNIQATTNMYIFNHTLPISAL
jgi:hypothetical protein